jgi:hypothetical protein
LRVEREPEHAALVAVHHEALDVEHRRREQHAVLHDADAAPLLEDEEPAAAVAGVDDLRRRAEPGDVRRQRERRGACERGVDEKNEQGNGGVAMH